MLPAVSFRDAIFWFVTSKTLWSKNSVSWEKVYANHLITCQSWLPWVSRHSLQIKMWLKKHDYSKVLLLPCFMALIYSCDWSVWIKTCYSTEELTRAFLVITLIPGSPGKPMLPTGPMSPWKKYSIHKTESHNLQEYILANYITGRTQRYKNRSLSSEAICEMKHSQSLQVLQKGRELQVHPKTTEKNHSKKISHILTEPLKEDAQ